VRDQATCEHKCIPALFQLNYPSFFFFRDCVGLMVFRPIKYHSPFFMYRLISWRLVDASTPIGHCQVSIDAKVYNAHILQQTICISNAQIQDA